jgi:hypothetical protein
MALLHPTWEFEDMPVQRDDKKIWDHLVDYASNKTGANDGRGKQLILDFLQVERKKQSFVRPNKFTITPVVTDGAVAPFPVPEKINGKYSIVEEKYYNFWHRGTRFNAQVESLESNDELVLFKKSTLTQFRGNGNYLSKIDGCKIYDETKWGFDFKGDTGIAIGRLCVDVLQNELLRPYLRYRGFVDELYKLDPADCRVEERVLFLLDKLRALFAHCAFDLNNLPVRYVQLDTSESTKDTLRDEEKNTLIEALEKENCPEPADGFLAESIDALKARLKKCKDKNRELKKFDEDEIDKYRLELDAFLWSRMKDGSRRRTDPSLYDLFELFSIDTTKTLQEAITEVIQIFDARKALPDKRNWETNLVYYGDRRNISERAVQESVLVNSMHYDNYKAYDSDIVRHLFRYPSLYEGGTIEKMHSQAFVSADRQLAQDFATDLRHKADVSKFLNLTKTPWPDTKRTLRRVNARSTYYPSKFVEARLPDSFYLQVKKEHEDCNRLRHVFYLLRLGKEKGYPVAQQVSVVTPEAYGTDYRTTRLPRTIAKATDASAEFWSGHLNYKQDTLKRRYGDDKVMVLPDTVHPLYPTKLKAKFRT